MIVGDSQLYTLDLASGFIVIAMSVILFVGDTSLTYMWIHSFQSNNIHKRTNNFHSQIHEGASHYARNAFQFEWKKRETVTAWFISLRRLETAHTHHKKA